MAAAFMSAPHPLAVTAARAGTLRTWMTISFEESVPAGWTRCSDVDAAHIAGWEARVKAWHRPEFGRTHPLATSGYVLSYYADIAPTVGALFFLADRRVPVLDRGSLAFRTDDEYTYVTGVAVLGREFWCLASDEAAGHSDATVVADEDALGEVLRAQVRRHADDFLASYRPGVRLPRRGLLGAFFDALDGGFAPERPGVGPGSDAAAESARVVLPGPTREFDQGSSFYLAVDEAGREHLTRRRVGCCYYYKVGDDGACTTCPRTTDDERVRRLVAETSP